MARVIRVTVTEFQAGLKLETGQWHRIVLIPDAVLLSFRGMFFETNKNFVMPSVLAHLRSINSVYEKFPDSKLLIVGHTDTSGDPSFNDSLSLERAQSVQAFLSDDADAWLARYAASVSESKRWGDREDSVMIRALQIRGRLDLPSPNSSTLDERIRAVQGQLGVTADGIIGPNTRRALITEYMAEDGTTLPESLDVTVHGCSEHFPLDDPGLELEDSDTVEDDKRDAVDRRVELFFFNGKDGIQPPPPGDVSAKGSTQYPTWRRQAAVRGDVYIPPGKVHAARLPSRFSRNSTFPKPTALPNLKSMAQLLRDDPMLDAEVLGFADAKTEPEQALELSQNRAQSVVAWLTADKDYFRARFDGPDPLRKWDWEEVQWMLRAVSSSDLPCYVGAVDGQAGPTTHDALAKLQVANGMQPTGLADDATLDVLIAQYLALVGDPIHAFRLFATGAKHHPLRTYGADTQKDVQDGAPQRHRRVEMFALEGKMTPPATALEQVEDSHKRWCSQVEVDHSQPRPQTTLARVVDVNRRPLAGVLIDVFESDGSNGAVHLVSATSDNRGIVRLDLAPGYYAVAAVVDDRTVHSGLSIEPDEYGSQTLALASTSEDG